MRVTNQIQEFIKNKEDVLKLPMLPLIEYNKKLESLGYTNDGDWVIEGCKVILELVLRIIIYIF